MPLTLSDLKYAVRLLIKSPWFTLLTVLVLSGGLGISIYTFAALNTMVYRDLPLPDGGSIVRIVGGDWPTLEPLDAFEWARLRADAETVSELGVFRDSRVLIGDPGAIRSVASTEADWAIFELTRTAPLLGRGFVSADSSAGAEPVAVLSYTTWQSIFSGDPGVVGDTVRINDRATRIVGVMPQGYRFPLSTEVWLPLGPQDLDPAGYTGNGLVGYARLRPGVSSAGAEAELSALLQRVRQQRPNAGDQDRATVSVLSFQQEFWGNLGPVLFGVFNMLSLSILLLAAVNVGNLLLARTNARVKEIGVRVALGAPRLRLIVQTTLENVILCAIGGLVAIFVAGRALEATDGFMNALLGRLLPFWWTWSLDREVVAAAAGLLLLTVLVVSVLPAFCVGRVDPSFVLRDSTRGSAGLRTGRISRGLVTAQVALISAVMVVGSAAVVIAQRAASFDPGMDLDGLFIMTVEPPAEDYPTAEERLSFYERLLAELRATPGIDAAAVRQNLPRARYAVEGGDYARPDDLPSASLVVLSEAPSPLGPALVEGRAFDARDSATGRQTAIVSESLARLHWPNASAIGRRIDIRLGDEGADPQDPDAAGRIVVGVVSDEAANPFDASAFRHSAIYVPLPQFTLPSAQFLIRHFGDEREARDAVYAALGRVDPSVSVSDVMSYASVLAQLTLFAGTMTKLLAGCGAFAILLAIAGIYGMSSNAVVLRSQEIGLRRALGASNGNVIALFVARGGGQLGVGLALSGLLSAAVLSIFPQPFSVDAWTLALIGTSVVVVVSAAVLISIYVSVRGVIGREPSAALRHG